MSRFTPLWSPPNDNPGGATGTPPVTEPPTQPPPTAPPADPGAAATTFTQEQVDPMLGKARGEARSAFAQELAEKFGTDDMDAVAAAFKAQQEADDATKSEAQRQLEAVGRERQELETKQAEADRLILEGKLAQALRTAVDENTPGINEAYLASAIKLGALHAAGSTAEDPVTEAVTALRAESPVWFVPSDGTPPPPTGTPPAPARGPGHSKVGNGSKTAEEIADDDYKAYMDRQGGSPMPTT